MIRHTSNKNLTLLSTRLWNGLEVQSTSEDLIVNYLESIFDVLNNAINDHPRTFVIRCELNFPSEDYEPDTAVISRFTDSLKAQMKAHANRKRREGKRVHTSNLRFIWVKERSQSHVWHYHVVLFVNYDAYFTLGRFKSSHQLQESSADEVNMSDRIRKAWASALNLSIDRSRGLVHFPKNPIYCLNAKDEDFDNEFKEVFYRLSYFAKQRTKHYGDRTRNFDCSRY